MLLPILNAGHHEDLHLLILQVQNLLEQPIGLALYTIKDGQLSHSCVQGGRATACRQQHVWSMCVANLLISCSLKAMNKCCN